MGSICDQPPRFNASQTLSEEHSLNKRITCNHEDLNEDVNLVNGNNEVDLITAEEEYFNDKNYYYTTVESNINEKLIVNHDNVEDAVDAHNDHDI